ncbi:MAG TPA: ATP-binding protein, partial [Gemmatimonadaceae bacterium]|nr:ATP-binding protein [Gemmatimonadaceae bacterium]
GGDEPPLPLEAVLASAELASRPTRAPDHAPESRALRAMARGLERSPVDALEALMREAVAACGADGTASGGVSLLEREAPGGARVRWTAVAGRLAPYSGSTAPEAASFCGACLERGEPTLFRHPGRHFAALAALGEPIVELLVVPLRVGGGDVGAVWVASHDEARRFDREDVRLLESLAAATAAIHVIMRAREEAGAEHRRVAASEARYRAVQEASLDASLLCRPVRDADGVIGDFVITYANPAARGILRTDDRPLEGRSLREAFPHAAARGRIAVYARVADTGQPLQEETFFEEDGEPRGLRVTAVRVEEGVHVTFADLTDRLRNAAERERLLRDAEAAQTAAEQANRAKGQFLAAMSHELRTPLNAIAGYVELLELGLRGPVTPSQRDALDRIALNQRHLLRLVNDVLNFSRLEAGRVEYQLEPVRVAEVVREIAPMVEPQIAAKGLAYAVEVSTERVVLADREKLKQVLVNLLSNAAKFTAPGGRVRVSCPRRADGTHPDGVAFLAVRDTGIGIPADKLESVFDPFVQVDTSASRRAAGAGLGLAISRDLVRGMGGDLRARSEEGRGSTFTVALREPVWGDGGPGADAPG